MTFTDNGDGTGTLGGTAAVAGSYALTLSVVNVAGQFQQPFTLDVSPGAFAQLQLLVPGETAAPGTASGVTGTPAPAYVNGPLQVTVNAVDGQWNLVNTVSDVVAISSSDGQAILPANAALAGGTGTFSVTLETAENAPTTTLTATDVTDGSKAPGSSGGLPVVVVYTASLSPGTAANGQATAYTLTVNNAAAPNTNSLQSVSVAVPARQARPAG